MKIDVPWLHSDRVQAVFGLLEKAGHQVFAVGGAVRNALLGQPVADIDFATDATPDEVMELARIAGIRTVPTGLDHGTVTLVLGGRGYEVTTFRRDLETDGRRARVGFTTSLAEDAARRDFTMNALYCDASGLVHDPVGGLPDLAQRRVVFVGDATQRIAEDYLRVLRFFRFYAWYGDPKSGPDPDGLSACARAGDGVETLAAERIGIELSKCLAAPDPAPAFGAMQATGLLARVLPGADTALLAPLVHMEGLIGEGPCWHRRLAALGGEGVQGKLRLSRADGRRIAALHEAIGSGESLETLAYRQDAEHAVDTGLLRAVLSLNPPPRDLRQRAEHAALAVFPVRARDLDPALKGPAIGQKLRELEDRWIASGFKLDRSALLS